jgi:P27 family predicted phage terminase small subunit
MPNPKQPIQLIQAKGNKHLTKSEIEERTRSEVQPNTDNIKPPKYLTPPQKKRFRAIVKDLIALGIMGNTDCDALGRYIIAEDMYIKITDKLAEAMESSDLYLDIDDFDIDEYMGALKAVEKYAGLQDKYFKQCRAAANDLGLSISARCRLVVPKAQEKPPENKFNKFQAQAG